MILQMSLSSNTVTHGHELAKAEETKDPAPGGVHEVAPWVLRYSWRTLRKD